MRRLKLLRSLLSIGDRIYITLDKRMVRRTRALEWIPDIRQRRMGRNSYAEWAHVIGVFQTLIQLYLPSESRNRILDIGCGTGVLAMAADACLGIDGRYTGIDVMEENVEFCRRHFASSPRHEFQFLPVGNPTYNRRSDEPKPWAVETGSTDLLTALSVWTHLNEAEAIFYFGEVARVLRPGGVAVVTFFYLDADYQKSLSIRTSAGGRYHRTSQTRWIFDVPCSDSRDWLHPRWAEHPEDAIGVTPGGLERLLSGSGLQLEKIYPGNWKEHPGLYFQDVLVFRRPEAGF